ncbi:MAG: hypothetical protein ACRD2L_10815 [Terriglobia bacterium]
MLELVTLVGLASAAPSPTTMAAAGLTIFLAVGGSAVRGVSPPEKTVQHQPNKDSLKNEATFSFIHAHPRELPQAFAEPFRDMLSLKSFKDGWDGEGSKQIANDSVNAALAFLALLPSDVAPPEASAASDGTVDWYWRKGSKAATVTFYKDRKAAYFALTDAGSVKDAFRLIDKIPAPLIESLRQL